MANTNVISIKNFSKGIYYKFSPQKFPENLKLEVGYIFHTEMVYDSNIFEQLIKFASDYRNLTTKRPIFAVMPGTNARIAHSLKTHGVSDSLYAERVHRLSEAGTLGYHGHFWLDPELHLDRSQEMKGEVFEPIAFKSQFERDIQWFEAHGLNHNGIYAAGWWFMNGGVLKSLLNHQFIADFSFSKSRWFFNPYSSALMKKFGIATGEVAKICLGSNALFSIQNLIGCHHTPFSMDFIRNFKALGLDPKQPTMTGVVNAHDFDLQPELTLNCLEDLAETKQVNFWDWQDLKQKLENQKLLQVPLETFQ